MEKDEKLRYVAGILLIISAITHNLQLFVHGFSSHQIGAALYGAIYGILGILLIKFKESKIINYFIVFHVIVDIIVVPICIYLFLKLRKKE